MPDWKEKVNQASAKTIRLEGTLEVSFISDLLESLSIIEYRTKCKFCGHVDYLDAMKKHIKEKHPDELKAAMDEFQKALRDKGITK